LAAIAEPTWQVSWRRSAFQKEIAQAQVFDIATHALEAARGILTLGQSHIVLGRTMVFLGGDHEGPNYMNRTK
jgi:hypothetical protein